MMHKAYDALCMIHNCMMLCLQSTSFSTVLTLINTALFYYYLTRRGRNHLRPPIDPKNQGLGVKHGRTQKYRQLLGCRKKMGSIPPKLGPYRGNQNFRQNVENRNFKISGIFTSFTKMALSRSFLVQFTSFLLHMDTDRLF